jgi:3-oxoacyl-[acyl-carrier protein] reductase
MTGQTPVPLKETLAAVSPYDTLSLKCTSGKTLMIPIDLSGKVALVTGASQGLGAMTLRTLHQAGASVVINYYPDANNQGQADAQQITEQLNQQRDNSAIAIAADVTNFEQVQAMIQQTVNHFGGLDIVVNNAGILRDRTLAKLAIDDWNAVIATNLTGVFHVCKAAAAVLRERGRVVNLGSIAGTMGFFGQSNYAAAKSGVAGMGRVLSRELARRNITVNTVAPGVVLTDMGKSIPEQVRDEMLKQIPLARFGQPADIANAILFLCSDLASYITGQTLHVSGGWYV